MCAQMGMHINNYQWMPHRLVVVLMAGNLMYPYVPKDGTHVPKCVQLWIIITMLCLVMCIEKLLEMIPCTEKILPCRDVEGCSRGRDICTQMRTEEHIICNYGASLHVVLW